MLTAAAWIATALILTTYALLSARPSEKHEGWFHLANAVGFVPLATLNALAGVWPAFVVNLGFGLPAVYAVLREISRRRKAHVHNPKFDYSWLYDVPQITGTPVTYSEIVPPGQIIYMRPDMIVQEFVGYDWYDDAVQTPDGLVPRSMFLHADNLDEIRTPPYEVTPEENATSFLYAINTEYSDEMYDYLTSRNEDDIRATWLHEAGVQRARQRAEKIQGLRKEPFDVV